MLTLWALHGKKYARSRWCPPPRRAGRSCSAASVRAPPPKGPSRLQSYERVPHPVKRFSHAYAAERGRGTGVLCPHECEILTLVLFALYGKNKVKFKSRCAPLAELFRLVLSWQQITLDVSRGP